MSNPVEGVWGNFTFKFIEKPDYDRVVTFLLKEYVKDELICSRTPDPPGEDSSEEFRKLYEWSFDLGDRLSFIAIDNETGEIAGVRATFIHHKDQDFSLLSTFKSTKLKALLKVVDVLDGEANMFERFGIDRMASLLSASTGRKYVRQGLASEMYKRSLALFKQQGIPFTRSIFSSPWTRKASSNLGFIEAARINLKDLKNEDGSQAVTNAQDEDFAIFGYLTL